MKTIFERSNGAKNEHLGECEVQYSLDAKYCREESLKLPELSEGELCRHYTALADNTFGVNNGFYPLGSCTMKYNPKINEKIASLKGFADIHPLQPKSTTAGAGEAITMLKSYLCEILGMDSVTLQPAAGAHGEFLGLLLIKAYHAERKDSKRNKIIVPDSAHGTNPASAVMTGFEIVNVPSTQEGMTDIEKLKEAVGDDTAGLMLTNPNTLGLFDENILEITDIIHKAGGLTYCDGANQNAIMGVARPGDMGFDIVHVNLHKTFSTPHGGGGPGSGPVGCKSFLSKYLPQGENSIGRVTAFYGNFLVALKALSYIMSLGCDGLLKASQTAVLSANYLKSNLSDTFETIGNGYCMHEFVITLEKLKKETGINALSFAKALLDEGMHPPTMYFPLIVPEALMLEPTETEAKENLDSAVKIFKDLYRRAKEGEDLHLAPQKTYISRVDEVAAARKPIVKM